MVFSIISLQFPQICSFISGYRMSLLGSMLFCENKQKVPRKSVSFHIIVFPVKSSEQNLYKCFESAHSLYHQNCQNYSIYLDIFLN